MANVNIYDDGERRGIVALINEMFYHLSGNPVDFKDGRGLILDDEASAWIVMEGVVHVFATELDEQGNTGRRHYISQFESGDILFGVKPYTIENKIDRSVALLCTGIAETKLLEINRRELQKKIKNLDNASVVYACVNKWAQLLTESTIDLLTDEEFENSTSLEIDNLIEGLNQFNQNAIKRAAIYIKDIYRNERQQLEGKQQGDEAFMTASLKKLVAATEKEKKKHKVVMNGSDYSKNPLAAACQIVGTATGIKIKLPPEKIMEKSKNLLFDIVKASQIRFRQVLLMGEWWKADNGPLLAFLTEGKVPVALIPITNNSYKILNPVDSTEKLIDSDMAGKLHPKAFMFYRVLPNKELKLLDIIKFSTQGSVKKDLIQVLLIGMMGGLLNMFVPIANGILFNITIPEGERGQLLQIAFLLVSFGISGVLFQLVRSFAMLRIESKTENSLQAAIWDRVISLPVPFFRQFSAGELAMRTMGFNKIRKEISGTVVTTMLSTIFTFFNLILLFQYSTSMAWYALMLIAVSLTFTYLCGRFQLRYKRELTEVTNKIAGQVLQIIGGIARFRIAGAEKRAFFQWAKAFGRQREIEFKNKIIENTLITFNCVFPIIASMILFYTTFSKNNMGTGSFIAFNSAFTGLMVAMVSLSSVILSINNVVTIYESMKPILQTVGEYDEIKEDPGELDGSIELSHITFRYSPTTPVIINDLSLKINKGEYLAIVGPSGCGKSTILRLLLGFEKPEAGNIYYGGHDIDKVDIRSIRRQLGVVMQNSQLVTGDIKSNIIGSNPNLNIEDAIEASKLAGIYEDIEAMPMGMFTAVSEGGSTLSGGQKQRLLIARVLVNKPKIIFFDEATSALDNKTQAIVSNSMDSMKATRIVIAHRLSTIINCDRILVIDKGRIVEEGTFEELMKNGNTFYELAKRQLA